MARAGAARGEIQMTEGSLWKNILLFSIPLVFSQLLQVMFNMADVAVVGKFAKRHGAWLRRLNVDARDAVHGLS